MPKDITAHRAQNVWQFDILKFTDNMEFFSTSVV